MNLRANTTVRFGSSVALFAYSFHHQSSPKTCLIAKPSLNNRLRFNALQSR